MALFVDGPIVTVDTLTQYDSNLLTASVTESINLTTKIAVAHESMYAELDRLMKRSEFSRNGWYGIQDRGVGNVVWSRPLKTWQVYETLGLVYRDAFYSQLNDRHKARAEEYAVLASQARRDCVDAGVGLVTYPVPRPAQPVVNLVPASEVGGTYYFAVTHINELAQESSASGILSVDVTDGNAADLTLAQPISALVIGWNLYAGAAPDQMFLQNTGALAIGTDWAYYPSLAVLSGTGVPEGQTADQHWPLTRFGQRG